MRAAACGIAAKATAEQKNAPGERSLRPGAIELRAHVMLGGRSWPQGDREKDSSPTLYEYCQTRIGSTQADAGN